MNATKTSVVFRTALALAAITFTLAVTARAQTHTLRVLHAFSGFWDGGEPLTGVIFDSSGNIYGTAGIGGNINACQGYGCGMVYKLSPTTGGGWQETSVFRFQSLNTGAFPTGNLLFDASGNLFGVDSEGGPSSNCVLFSAGCGLVFELSPTSTNSWQESVLRTFNNGTGGGALTGGLVADAAGNFYGAAYIGGNLSDCSPYGCGNVFRLSPNGSGGWQETVLYNFTGGVDGALPAATLIFDGAGNLYGTAAQGGSNNTQCQPRSGCGVVFELSPTASGPWTQTVLHTFTGGSDGSGTFAGLVFDTAGNLYGTALNAGNLNDCGGGGCGVVFELSPSSGGGWTETVLHTFTGHNDGGLSFSALIRDPAGNLYGTASSGGNLSDCGGHGCGVIFKLAPNSSGGWSETVLHAFTNGWDGSFPQTPLALGADGNLYGTTGSGGGTGQGVVFSIAP